jgi:hypothetical protein
MKVPVREGNRVVGVHYGGTRHHRKPASAVRLLRRTKTFSSFYHLYRVAITRVRARPFANAPRAGGGWVGASRYPEFRARPGLPKTSFKI